MVHAYDILNREKWAGNLSDCEIIILHRGAPDDRKAIPGSSVTRVGKHSLDYTDPKSGETYIPYHRILEVKVRGKVAWQKGK